MIIKDKSTIKIRFSLSDTFNLLDSMFHAKLKVENKLIKCGVVESDLKLCMMINI